MDNEMDNSEFHEGRESAKEKARSAVDAYKKIYEEDCTKLKELNEKFVKSADTLVDNVVIEMDKEAAAVNWQVKTRFSWLYLKSSCSLCRSEAKLCRMQHCLQEFEKAEKEFEESEKELKDYSNDVATMLGSVARLIGKKR